MAEGSLHVEDTKPPSPEEVLEKLSTKASGKNVFYMSRVTKTIGERVIFRDVNISFFRGAKIGLLGLNGVGKV